MSQSRILCVLCGCFFAIFAGKGFDRTVAHTRIPNRKGRKENRFDPAGAVVLTRLIYNPWHLPLWLA
jgi:hypothetical protein